MEQPAESPGWAGNPNYVVDFDPVPARVAVGFNGETVAESDRARVMFELGHAPVYYLPRDDLAADRFTRTDHHSFCPYKGVASYWSLTVGDQTADNVVWCYENPYPQLPELGAYAGFYWGRMGSWTEAGEPVAGPREIPGRIDTTNQMKALLPALAREWHPSRNPGTSPYEFAADSNTEIWWQAADGREWRQRIKDRVLSLTTLRGDGDATPYG